MKAHRARNECAPPCILTVIWIDAFLWEVPLRIWHLVHNMLHRKSVVGMSN